MRACGKGLIVLLGACLLSGCFSNHAYLGEAKFDFPVHMDKFHRSVELEDNWMDPMELKPEVLAYYATHPLETPDVSKGRVFPFLYLRSELGQYGDHFEYTLNGRVLLGLWLSLSMDAAFDESGKADRVAHLKGRSLMGAWWSGWGELDFTTQTVAGRAGYFFKAFGKKKTHSGKETHYFLWIPYKTTDKNLKLVSVEGAVDAVALGRIE